jgi:hypothetical protein
MTKDEATKLVAKHGSVRAAARAIGRDRSVIRRALAGTATKPTVSAAVAPKKSLSDFKAAYDKDTIVPAKIKAGIKLLAGGWEYEMAFAKLAGISSADLATYREQFQAYVVNIKRDSKRAWASTPKMAEEMRRMV